MLWERSVTEQRYNAVLEVLEAGLPVTEVAERYGVSRQSVHTWVNRYRVGGLEGLADRSHRPNRCPHQLAVAVEARVCELRRQHPGWGPQRLRDELARRGIEPLPSRAAVYRLLVRNRLITPDRRRRRRAWRRWERERPMQLWQLDLVELPLVDGPEIKVLTGVDDHSRYCVSSQAMVQATGRAVCRGLVAALRRYGVPEEVLTDNGKQFTGRFGQPRPAEVLFERILRENGITHRFTRVRAPSTGHRQDSGQHSQRREEPAGLSAGVGSLRRGGRLGGRPVGDGGALSGQLPLEGGVRSLSTSVRQVSREIAEAPPMGRWAC